MPSLNQETKALILKLAQNEEDRLFLAKLLDKASQADDGYMVYSNFMDPHQRSLASKLFRSMNVRVVMDGGYPTAERVVSCFLPEYFEVQPSDSDALRLHSDYPLCLINIDFKKNKYTPELTHRDYLGAIMSLGIKRETLGDLLVHPDKCQLIVLEDIALFLESHLNKVSNVEVVPRRVSLHELSLPEVKTRQITATVASLRLDAVTAEAYNLSRSEAVRYIEAGKVFLNFEECIHPAEAVKEGSNITLRGMGRAVLSSVGSLSKKNRIFITITRLI